MGAAQGSQVVVGRRLLTAGIILFMVGGCAAGGHVSGSPAAPTATPALARSSVPTPSATDVANASPMATDPNSATLHRQAEAALHRWATAVEAAGGERAVVLIGDLTGQIAGWEEAVGGNNKEALYACGLVEAAVALPSETSEGEIRWPSGATKPVHIVSASQALAEIRASMTPSCRPELRPLRITAARLTTGDVRTDRGPATAPVWEFSLQGTAVKATRVAVAEQVRLTLPERGIGASILSASGREGERGLTVNFVGSPATGDKPCGADYTAEAVESDLAIVVIVHAQRRPGAQPLTSPVACAAIGASRSAPVTLAAPLGRRTVLEVTQGLPVPTLLP